MITTVYVAMVVCVFSSLFATVVGLALWRRSDRQLKLVTLLLVFTQIILVAQILIKNILGNNLITLHAYTAGSYIIIALVFSGWHKASLSILIKWSILVYTGIHIALLMLGIEQLDQMNKYSEQVAAFAVAVLTLYTIFSIADGSTELPLNEHPLFWISLGLFMLFPGPIFATAAVMKYYSFSLHLIYFPVAFIGYCLISIGFLCLKLKN